MNQIIVVLLIAAVCFCGTSYARGTTPSAMENNAKPQTPAETSLYEQGVEASHNNDFQKALELFDQALREDPNNPDIINMLAHSQRKTGKIDEALANYKKALEIRPNFPEAREYLGEAYIQAALREVEILKTYGSNGKEELEDLTKAIKEAGEKL
jgi:Tfp pilus assembly protein PilF